MYGTDTLYPVHHGNNTLVNCSDAPFTVRSGVHFYDPLAKYLGDVGTAASSSYQTDGDPSAGCNGSTSPTGVRSMGMSRTPTIQNRTTTEPTTSVLTTGDGGDGSGISRLPGFHCTRAYSSSKLQGISKAEVFENYASGEVGSRDAEDMVQYTLQVRASCGTYSRNQYNVRALVLQMPLFRVVECVLCNCNTDVGVSDLPVLVLWAVGVLSQRNARCRCCVGGSWGCLVCHGQSCGLCPCAKRSHTTLRNC